jgi:hypothetical protein
MNNQYPVDLGTHGKIKINFWALEPIYEPGKKINWKDIRKGYVSHNNAVFFTLNGQKHDIIKSSFLRDKCDLTYSHEYLIVQVDCDELTNLAKKQLFSSTRERMTEGEMKELLLDELAKHLGSDSNILRFEKERKKEILSAKTSVETTKIKKMVGKYISKNPVLSALIKKEQKERFERETAKRETSEDKEDKIEDEELEIPELNPIPTYLKITNKLDPIPIEKGGSAIIRLEADTEDAYLVDTDDEKFRSFHEHGITRKKSRSRLRNGKITYHVFCPPTVRVGNKENIRFELALPSDTFLSVEREIICRHPIKRKKVKKQKKIPEPKIIPLTRGEELWDRKGYDERSVGEIWLAGEDSAIIVSLENTHLQKIISKKGIGKSIIENTKDRYVAAISYYLLLRKVDMINSKTNGDKFDESHDSIELQRLANTISVIALPIDLPD